MAKHTQRTKAEADDAGIITARNETTATGRRRPGPRPGTEAAKRGGTAAREKYGREFYSRIGAKGGSTVRQRRGSSFYTEIGRLGGEATKRNLGKEHYARIGRLGGLRARGGQDTGREEPTSGADNSTR